VTELALVVAAGTLGAGLAAGLALRWLPSVRLQLVGLALLAVALPLAAVLLAGLVMFHMNDDVEILAVAGASASTALVAALLIAGRIARRVAALEAATNELASGELTARAPTDGPRELAHVGEAFNAMASDIEALFDARRQLVAWASHDLRTPVASIQAMLEAIEDRLASADEYLPALRQQTQTLAGLIDDLFELARIDAGALTLELQRLPVAGIVDSALRLLEPEAAARHVDLVAHSEGETTADVAPEKIERVLFNLITNALRHTPSDGSVAVNVARVDGQLLVSVEDTGAGIEPEALGRMFERFWRADRARSEAGMGLGLAIARGLVEAHGGRIWAENREQGGARVSFTLPAPAEA
jgi:signal transduction histidine kinase